MEKLLGVVKGVTGDFRNDDDWTDRLSHRYTVMFLVGCTIVSGFMYSSAVVSCWSPPHFTDAQSRYVKSYCWVKNTYYYPFMENVPKQSEERRYVIYYQWTPFILLAQAVFFFLPSIFWHGLNQRGGMDADSILKSSAQLMETSKEDSRNNLLSQIARVIDRFVKSRLGNLGGRCSLRNAPQLLCKPCCGGRRFSSYLTILFLLSKVLYLANVVAQFFILSRVLGFRYNTIGADILSHPSGLSDTSWSSRGVVAFPRVTLCDMEIRRLGNLHRYTIQCMLPLNMYNEKIFVMIWWWMFFVATVSALSLLVWVGRAIFRSDRVKFIRNHLSVSNRIDKRSNEDEALLQKFIDVYLRQDGAFLLRLIAHNTNNITVTDIIVTLWDQWNEKKDVKSLKEPPNFPLLYSKEDEAETNLDL